MSDDDFFRSFVDYVPVAGEFPWVGIDEIGALLGLKRGAIRNYMRGHKGNPPMPYVRFGSVPFFNKVQVARWLRAIQLSPDRAMVQVRHARKELGVPE